VPVKETVDAHVQDVFSQLKAGEELNAWNIYSPLWCKVQMQGEGAARALTLRDSDPFDYAKAERVFPVAEKISLEFAVTPQQQDHGSLQIELVDAKGTPCIRLTLDSAGVFHAKAGYRNRTLSSYKAGEKLEIKLELNTANRFYTVFINGKNAGNNIFFAPVQTVERIVFRTGSTRRFPDADTPTDQMYDLPNAGEQTKEAVYHIHYLKTGAR
jgi:hypothetical protein